jgi:predicted Zn-dependent peptidase
LYERTTLANGLRLLSSNMPHTRSVSIGIFVGAGSRYEDDAHAGASHYLEHMLFKGTEKRPEPRLISSAIESVGGMLNASTDREITVYWTKVARPNFELGLDVLMDMVLHPTMPADEVERERNVILEELAMTNDQPDARVDLLMDETLWPSQAMGRDVGGSKESVLGISREMLTKYMQNQYRPNNTVIAVAGNVTHQEVLESVGALVEGWKPGKSLSMEPVREAPVGVRVAVENRKTDQAHVCLAFPGVSMVDEQRYPLDLLNTVLGEGMSSRLFMEVRERRGLAYAVHSGSAHYRDTGAVVVYCGVDPTKTDEAVKAILGELNKIKETIPEEELASAKSFVGGRLLLRMEDTRAVMGWMGGQEILLDRVLSPDEVVARLNQVTAEQIAEVAQKLIVPESFSMAVVGPYRSEARFRKLLAA